MHHQLSTLLQRDVCGELVVAGETLREGAHGRICLDVLSREGVREVLAQLEGSWKGSVEVCDRLHLQDAKQPIRGVMEVRLGLEGGSEYLLEIGHASIFELYERRFLLDEKLWADLRGVLVDTLHHLINHGFEAPLRMISGFDQLLADYLQQLDHVLGEARAGRKVNLEAWLHEFSRRLRQAWELIPWALRMALEEPLYGRPCTKTVPCDAVFDTTLIFAVNMMEGSLPRGVEHVSVDPEPSTTELRALAKTHASLTKTFVAPYYAVGIARAPSVDSFIEAFSRYKKAVGSIRLADELKLG
ncbi:MAG: hypothetical protein JRH20_29935 [Deltaproteobacteria bacterium]|nr:hypothetical protein [Deltaproteobacteria bacterium]